ncbi:MAG: ABC transporter substrate-binding protein [Clostridia bacterium]|nr:ABC transporter substrate-binding protein [Clostridia bacterium]
MARLLSFFCAVIISLGVFCSCGSNTDDSARVGAKTDAYIDDSNTLRLCIYNTDTLNPLKTKHKHNAFVLSLFYDNLFSVSADFSPVLNLADDFSVSKSGLTYRIKIRDGVRFHDGSSLTARDVCASINTILSSDGYYKSRLYMIKGAMQKGEYVEIYLNEPVANLPALLDFPILPHKSADVSEDILDTIISGSGIYKVKEYVLNKEIHLEPNEEHHSGKIANNKDVVILMAKDYETASKMFQNEIIDALEKEDGFVVGKSENVAYFPTCRFVFMGINTNKNTPNVRRFISDSINRDELVFNVGCSPCHFPVHPSSFYSEGSAPDNLENGFSEKLNSSFELLVNQESSQKRIIAEKIKENLQEAEIEIKVVSLPYKDYKNRIDKGKYDFFIGEAELLPNFDFGEILPLLKCDTKNFEENINRLKLESNIYVQKSIYSDICDTFEITVPALPLFFRDGILVFSKRVKTDKISTINPYQNIDSWQISN